MTAGGLHRFHAVVQVQGDAAARRPAAQRHFFAAGALKDLDLVIVVDEDIDIRDPHDVEYALATRMEASRDLIVMPPRAATNTSVSVRTRSRQFGIDATIPFAEKARFARCAFEQVTIDPAALSSDPELIRARLDL